MVSIKSGLGEGLNARIHELTVIHVLIVISAIVMPSCAAIALLVKTCPMKATVTVTKDISIVLAKTAISKLAVDNGTGPLVDIVLPHLGSTMAVINQMPLNMVEYMDVMRSQTAGQLRRSIRTLVGARLRRGFMTSGVLRARGVSNASSSPSRPISRTVVKPRSKFCGSSLSRSRICSESRLIVSRSRLRLPPAPEFRSSSNCA